MKVIKDLIRIANLVSGTLEAPYTQVSHAPREPKQPNRFKVGDKVRYIRLPERAAQWDRPPQIGENGIVEGCTTQEIEPRNRYQNQSDSYAYIVRSERGTNYYIADAWLEPLDPLTFKPQKKSEAPNPPPVQVALNPNTYWLPATATVINHGTRNVWGEPREPIPDDEH